jgi:hypothetical protein
VGDRWGPDGPPDDAYSRVTDPERFAPVVNAADALVDQLATAYDVVVTRPEPAQRDFPGVPLRLRSVRLTPSAGAPLTVTVTDFPGLLLAAGHWWSVPVPPCGCDACDETAPEALEQLDEHVAAVIGGRFTERLTERPMRLWHGFSGEHRSEGWSALDPGRFAEYAATAPPGDYAWPPWPRRRG